MKISMFFRGLLKSSEGTSAIEYGLILGLIAIGLIVAIANVADETAEIWNFVASETEKSMPVW